MNPDISPFADPAYNFIEYKTVGLFQNKILSFKFLLWSLFKQNVFWESSSIKVCNVADDFLLGGRGEGGWGSNLMFWDNCSLKVCNVTDDGGRGGATWHPTSAQIIDYWMKILHDSLFIKIKYIKLVISTSTYWGGGGGGNLIPRLWSAYWMKIQYNRLLWDTYKD